MKDRELFLFLIIMLIGALGVALGASLRGMREEKENLILRATLDAKDRELDVYRSMVDACHEFVVEYK